MSKRQFQLTALLVAALAIPVAIYFGYHRLLRERHRKGCRNQLSLIASAIHAYEADKGRMPPAYITGQDGKPWHSWRVLILPYLKRQDLFDSYRFDEPWNGPNNSRLVDRMPEVYGCPADRTKRPGMASYRDAKQSVRFLLKESGARIESGIEYSGMLGNGHDQPPPPKPRHFVLDKPFLLYVKEPKADAPYLVIWAANGEIMQPVAAK